MIRYALLTTHLSSQFFTTIIIFLERIIRINKYRSQKATFQNKLQKKFNYFHFLKRLNSINKPRFKRNGFKWNGFKHVLNPLKTPKKRIFKRP